MAVNTIDAQLLAKMFLGGAQNLTSKKEWINELNVFPVPDGDTGTNMSMTIMSAAKEVTNLGDQVTCASLAKAISSGSLRGARGNSGVILSQLFRGFCKVIGEVDDIDVFTLSCAFEKAVESAYKAVMKPKEGTILTVAKGIFEKGQELSDCDDMELFLTSVLEYGEEVLASTPEMLPVLKQAGVVDSGGQGLIEVLRGCVLVFQGKEIQIDTSEFAGKAGALQQGGNVTADLSSMEHIKYGYCTEFIIQVPQTFTMKQEIAFKEFLESIGDSIVVVADDEIVKVHVHTNDPGIAIQRALTYGFLSNMKIDNMRLEHEERLIQNASSLANAQNPSNVQQQTQVLSEASQNMAQVSGEKKEVGFISVSIGEGINAILKDLGVDCIIEGGQTMNPSTEDILTAIDQVNADTIFVLPNNKNIVLAANQASSLVEDKRIVVIPTKTVPQGITAIINYLPDLDIDENIENMTNEIERVKTGQVTYAVRDTQIDGKTIHQNDIMGIGDQGILSVGQDIMATTIELVDEMLKGSDLELISIYYGADVTAKEAEKLKEAVEEKYPDCDVELQSGGQPIYYYVISAE